MVIAEHDNSVLNDSVFKVITAAKFWDTPIDLLVMGKNTDNVANQAAKIKDLSNIIRVDADHLEHLLAEDAAKTLENEGISCEIIDPRTYSPLDEELIFESVKKTGKVIIVHEDCMIGGFGADIASFISDECFEFLDAPVARSASLDTPVPFVAKLEDNYLPKNRFETQLKQLLNY